MNTKPLLGSHMSLSKKGDYLEGVAEATIAQNANTFMIFTGSPQSTTRIPVAEMKLPEMKKILDENHIEEKDLVVHAPYLINLSNCICDGVWKFSINLLLNEIKRCEEIGIHTLVLHPGSFTKGTHEEGVQQLIKALDLVTEHQSPVIIALETMSGKGSEIGGKIEDLATVLHHVKRPERIGICLDTCHLNDAGYDVKNWSEFKNLFQKLIPLEKVKAIHLNDSKSPLGAKKDRHENIGYGTIGFEALSRIVWDDTFKNVPKILETPYVDGKPPYPEEIRDLLENKFHGTLK